MEEMNPEIWSRLPRSLMDRILACLPTICYIRMRTVCKRFYTLMFSHSFLELCKQHCIKRPHRCFLLFHKGETFMLDPATKAWNRLPPVPGTPAASLGGLLCYWTQSNIKSLAVSNPVTQTGVIMPRTTRDRFVPSVGMAPRGVNGAYAVLVAGDDMISPFAVKNLTAEVMDVDRGSWRVTSSLPRLCSLESGRMVYADGRMYCMNYSPFSVLSYDLADMSWAKVQAPMRRFLKSPSLVEWRGRIVMVGGVEKSKLSVPRSVRMWALQHSRCSWVEIDRMPHSLYEELFGGSPSDGHGQSFSCVSNGDFLLLSVKRCPDVVVYDFYEKVWCWAPRCRFLHRSLSLFDFQGFQCFPFEPCLHASPSPKEM